MKVKMNMETENENIEMKMKMKLKRKMKNRNGIQPTPKSEWGKLHTDMFELCGSGIPRWVELCCKTCS